MPYIVETRHPPTIVMGENQNTYTSRLAFRDLDSAKKIIEDKIQEQWGYFGKSIKSPPDHLRDLRDMTNQGGKIGMLPDGTTIEVRKATYAHLYYALPREIRMTFDMSSHRTVLKRYNAMGASIGR